MKFLVEGSLTKEERKVLEDKGLFCYELRDTDMKNDIGTIEEKVLANNIGSIITNEKLVFGEYPQNSINYMEFILENEQVDTIEELLTNSVEKEEELEKDYE